MKIIKIALFPINELGETMPLSDGSEAVKLKDGRIYWTGVMNHWTLIHELKSRDILTDDNFYDFGWVDKDGVFTPKS